MAQGHDSLEQYFQQIHFYLKNKNLALAEQAIRQLDDVLKVGRAQLSFPSVQLFEKILGKFEGQAEGLKGTFFLNLLSQLIFYKTHGQVLANDDIEEFLRQYFIQFNKLVPMDINEIFERQWMPVPVLVVPYDQQKSLVNWFFISFSSSSDMRYPQFFPVSDESKQAIDRAFEAFKTISKRQDRNRERELPSNFSIFALTSSEVKGVSLALPIGIGFQLLWNKSGTWPIGVFATGDVREDGTLGPVTHLEAKIAYFQDLSSEDKSFFIYPHGSSGSVPLDPKQPFIPLTNLEQACLAALRARELSRPCVLTRQLEYLDDPDGILRNIDKVETFILLAAIDLGKFSEFKPSMAKNFRRFDKLADALNSRQGWKKVAVPLSGLLGPEETKKLLEQEIDKPDIDQELVNRLAQWTSLQFAVHNHFSHTDIKPWKEIDNLLEDAAATGKIELDDSIKIQWQNRKVVSLFNNFHFSDDDLLVIDLKKKVEEFCKGYPKSRNFHVAAACGTLSQLYGFRGELEKCQEFITFGEKIMPLLEDSYERRRLKSYDLYSSLDHGKIDHAFKSLMTFLGLKDLSKDLSLDELLRPDLLKDRIHKCIEEQEERNQPYLYHALFRFLADYLELSGQRRHGNSTHKVALREMIETIGKSYQKQPERYFFHPHQLIFLNLGRIAMALGMAEHAKAFWHNSFQVCEKFKENFFAMEIMALMPVACIYKNFGTNALKDNEFCFAKYLIEAIKGDHYPPASFNRNHFQLLVDNRNDDMETCLGCVFDNMKKLFPFSYR